MPAKEHFVTQVVRDVSKVEAGECSWRESLTKRTSTREEGLERQMSRQLRLQRRAVPPFVERRNS